jgi:prepilin-type N-terminal cleavage/methylation domain-containing protein
VTLWLAQSRTRGAFTLIELMMAVLVLALLTSAAALSLSRPIASARERDAMDQLASFDAASRQAAIAAGAPVRIVFDLSTAALLRRDGRDLSELRCRTMLPTGCRIEQVRIGSAEFSSGEVFVDVSPLGLTRSYAVQISGPQAQHWIVVAGLTGQSAEVGDERAVASILPRQERRRD